MTTVRVNLGNRSYDIRLTTGDQSGFAPFVRTALPKATIAFVVTDANATALGVVATDALRQSGLRTETATVPAGEASKSAPQVERLYDVLAEVPADRNTAVIAVGGGVIGDLAGFVAATYNRGLPLLMVPTTLLAMVDSSVGGKVGINHAKGKNLIGAFHQPAGVWIDTEFLNTLPDREYRSGLAEVVKYGVIFDPELFAFLETRSAEILARDPECVRRIVKDSCRLKADVVEKDEREETGLRAVLNYGHTFAHAFETIGGYGAWLHGEAVAAGMVCAARLAVALNHITQDVADRQLALLNRLNLPIEPKPTWSTDALIDVMRRDKKSLAGKLRFVLPTRLGHAELMNDIPESAVREALHPCR